MSVEHAYELSGIRPARFLINRTHLNKMPEIPPLPNHTMTPNITKNYVEVIESLFNNHIEEKGRNRKLKKQGLKLITSPDIHQSFTEDGVEQCCLIACVASDRV